MDYAGTRLLGWATFQKQQEFPNYTQNHNLEKHLSRVGLKMFSPNPHPPNLSSFDGKNNFNSLNSRRRPRPSHQSQPSITATLTAHPPKKPRQRSVSAQRQLNASPEAQAVLAASASALTEQATKQTDRKGVVVEWV